MIELVPYESHHLKTFDPGIDEILLLESRGGELEGEFENKALSVIEDGKTLGIFGMGYMNGIPRIAALLSDELRQRPYLLHRGVKRHFKILTQVYGFEAVEADAKLDNEISNRWLLRLGFEFDRIEGDYNVYRWSKK